MGLTAISYGGGVQSTALVVLAATGRLDEIGLPTRDALFSNVGDDSEHPSTIDYVRNVITPWAADRGVTVHELHRERRDGTRETLLDRLVQEGSRSLPIPVRMPDTGAPGNRSCTVDFKIRVVLKWLKAHGATADNPAQVCIGFSTDELHRASNKRPHPEEVPRYPLLDLGLSRTDCLRVIAAAGLPEPRKSACYFCPFHRRQTWAEMRRDEPALFWASQDIEDLLNRRRDELGKDHVYLTRYGRRLADAIPEAQPTLPGLEHVYDDGGCDDGYCWT